MSPMAFEGKIDFPNAKHKRIYKVIMELIANDCERLLKTETSQKFLF